MIVLDVSVLTELLTDVRGLAPVVIDRLAQDTRWAGPEHLRIETASALRGLWLGGYSTDGEFERQLGGLAQVDLLTAPVAPMLPRIRELASNVNVYDAAYLALAELLPAALLTLDRKLTNVPRSTAEVVLLG